MWNAKPSSGFKFKPRSNMYQDGSNNEFNPESIQARSYRHWLYVTKVKGKVIFNDYNYSSTTSNHQSNMKDLLKQLKIKIDLVVRQRESLDYGIKLDEVYSRLALAEIRAIAPNRKTSYYKDQKDIIETAKKEIALLKKFGAKSDMTLVNHRVNAKQNEVSRLATQRAISKQSNAIRKEVMNQYKDAYESTQAVEV